MKCPKCNYLGFETGDRCRNCGYDFSLLTGSSGQMGSTDTDLPAIDATMPATLAEAVDLPLRDPDPPASRSNRESELERPVQRATPKGVHDSLGSMPLGGAVTLPTSAAAVSRARPVGDTRTAARTAVPSLPLFQPGRDQDEPLIKLPAAPRPPLAVRRTPDRPRPRAVPKPARQVAAAGAVTPGSGDPALQFLDELPERAPADGRPPMAATAAHPIESSGAVRRFAAAAIDHGILLAVDVIVVYLTLKMAAVAPGDWQMLPPVPLLAFLGMVKVAYFCAFTLVGGQTIGKMAFRIRVVGDDGAELDPARAIQRTLAGALSFLAVGLGFLPVLIADDRRGVHDRVARTRVIALPSK